MTALLSAMIALIFFSVFCLVVSHKIKYEFLSHFFLGLSIVFLSLIAVMAAIPQTDQFIIALFSVVYQLILVVLTGFAFYTLIMILQFALTLLWTSINSYGGKR